MFENFYFIFIIGFFVGIGFLSLIIFLRKDKTDIKENTDLISLKNHMQSIQQSLQNFNLAQDRIENTLISCLLYTSPSPRDKRQSRMPSSA